MVTKEFEKSVVTFQTAVDECFKACTTGSIFHRGSLTAVGDMNINGFRVERGTYSNELRASCECVEIPETPEECEIRPVKGRSTLNPYEMTNSYTCSTGYIPITTKAACKNMADVLGGKLGKVVVLLCWQCAREPTNLQLQVEKVIQV